MYTEELNCLPPELKEIPILEKRPPAESAAAVRQNKPLALSVAGVTPSPTEHELIEKVGVFFHALM